LRLDFARFRIKKLCQDVHIVTLPGQPWFQSVSRLIQRGCVTKNWRPSKKITMMDSPFKIAVLDDYQNIALAAITGSL